MLQHLYGVDGVRTSDDAGDVSESEPGGACAGVVSMSTAIVMFLESIDDLIEDLICLCLMFANFDFSCSKSVVWRVILVSID